MRGDRGQLAQLFQNLIANAMKFARPGIAPVVHIEAHRQDGMWSFVVADNGIGIEPQYADRIFGMFQRLHARRLPGDGDWPRHLYADRGGARRPDLDRSERRCGQSLLLHPTGRGSGASMNAEVIQILLVEDSPADVELTIEAMRDAKVANQLHVVIDGVEAMAFLRREGRYSTAPRPDLVLLDLNLPRKNGKEVLSEIRADEDLQPIPVAVLTTSKAESDILRSYQLGANCFLTKPVRLGEFMEVVHAIEEFWLTIVRLPPRTSQAIHASNER